MKWFFVFVWLLCGSICSAPIGKGMFGVCISYQATGAYTTYIAYLKSPNGISHKRRLQEDEFIKFAAGYWPSVYNPDNDNMFATNRVGCGIEMDIKYRIEYKHCAPLDSLWKIRFSLSPLKESNEEGWSGKSYRPSPGQEQFLYKEFGVKSIDHDYFADTSFWKLLRCVKDPEWINYYKNLP